MANWDFQAAVVAADVGDAAGAAVDTVAAMSPSLQRLPVGPYLVWIRGDV